jgi:hypothetical protein
MLVFKQLFTFLKSGLTFPGEARASLGVAPNGTTVHS